MSTTNDVLRKYLSSRSDPSLSRRKKRKARVAWILLRTKRARWHGKGEFTRLNRYVRPVFRAHQRQLATWEAELNAIVRRLLTVSIREEAP